MNNNTRSLNVAMVGPYPLNGKVAGGVEGVSATLVGALKGVEGVNVQVITAATDAPSPQASDEPSLVVVPQSKRLRRLTLYRTERQRIVRSIRRANPDLVHVQGQNWYAVAALAAGYPTLVTLHGMARKEALIVDRRSALLEQLSRGIRGLFNAQFETRTLAQARHIVVISPYVRECIEGRTEAHLYEAPNPVDGAFLDLEPREVPGRVLFVGLISPRKALHHLLEAVLIVRSRRPHVRLHVVGMEQDKGYARTLRSFVSDHGLDENVRFVGFVEHDQLLGEYSECSVLALTSREETSPLAIQQAMAAGKAVVATRAGGVPYLVRDGVDGCLVEQGDVPQLASALDSLLGDDARRQRLGAAAKRSAQERFRAEVIARRTADIYHDVLKEASHPAVGRAGAGAGLAER